MPCRSIAVEDPNIGAENIILPDLSKIVETKEVAEVRGGCDSPRSTIHTIIFARAFKDHNISLLRVHPELSSDYDIFGFEDDCKKRLISMYSYYSGLITRFQLYK